VSEQTTVEADRLQALEDLADEAIAAREELTDLRATRHALELIINAAEVIAIQFGPLTALAHLADVLGRSPRQAGHEQLVVIVARPKAVL
jgi:hypothetical protein